MDIYGSFKAMTTDMYQVFSTNAFPVGVNGVKPDFKGVSARLDTREETRSEPQ